MTANLKVFADNQINVGQMIISACDRIENTVGKEEMVVTSIFSFFHSILKTLLLQYCKKLGLLGEGLMVGNLSTEFQRKPVKQNKESFIINGEWLSDNYIMLNMLDKSSLGQKTKLCHICIYGSKRTLWQYEQLLKRASHPGSSVVSVSDS